MFFGCRSVPVPFFNTRINHSNPAACRRSSIGSRRWSGSSGLPRGRPSSCCRKRRSSLHTSRTPGSLRCCRCSTACGCCWRQTPGRRPQRGEYGRGGGHVGELGRLHKRLGTRLIGGLGVSRLRVGRLAVRGFAVRGLAGKRFARFRRAGQRRRRQRSEAEGSQDQRARNDRQGFVRASHCILLLLFTAARGRRRAAMCGP